MGLATLVVNSMRGTLRQLQLRHQDLVIDVRQCLKTSLYSQEADSLPKILELRSKALTSKILVKLAVSQLVKKKLQSLKVAESKRISLGELTRSAPRLKKLPLITIEKSFRSVLLNSQEVLQLST